MTAYYQQVLEGTYDNHVLPFLWMKGESHKTIAEYLEKIAGADIHEVCLESRPHPDFCGEGWWRDLRFVIDECKQLGLKLWILDDAHFPTGFANGAVKEAVPELRKIVLTHRTLNIVGPTSAASIALANTFDKTEHFYGVTFMQDGSPVDVAYRVIDDADGNPSRLVFDAPAGLTQACVMFTSGKTSYNEDYINMVDRASVAQLIDAVYEPHFEHLGDEFGKTILGFFSDEPGFANEKGTTGPTASRIRSSARPPRPCPGRPSLSVACARRWASATWTSSRTCGTASRPARMYATPIWTSRVPSIRSASATSSATGAARTACNTSVT